jgi:hypothetical protein
MKRKAWIEANGDTYGPDATGAHCYTVAYKCPHCEGTRFNRMEPEVKLTHRERVLLCVKCNTISTTPGGLHWDAMGDLWRQL